MSYLAVDEFVRANLVVKGLILGAIGAAACYVRPTALLIPAILCGLEVVRGPRGRLLSTIGKCVIVYLAMLALIAPWSIRNTRVFGSFVHVATNGGANFWMGNNPSGSGGYQELPPELPNMNEAARDKYLGGIAKAYVVQYPGRFVVRTVEKLFQLNSHETIGVHWNEEGIVDRLGTRAIPLLKVVNDGYWFLALFLGLFGIFVLARQLGTWNALTHPNFALWAYFTLAHAVIVVQDRYHMPSVPFIAIFAALSIQAIRQRSRSNQRVGEVVSGGEGEEELGEGEAIHGMRVLAGGGEDNVCGSGDSQPTLRKVAKDGPPGLLARPAWIVGAPNPGLNIETLRQALGRPMG
jgi:hypothetical protein